MREGLPSRTSFVVAFARGLNVRPEPLDPLAAKLLPGILGGLAALPERLGPMAGWYRASMRKVTFGLVDHVVLRTLAIDAHLEDAFQHGAHQLVILGAGLDARAYRLASLRSRTVYEVDHPSTQQYKRQRMSDDNVPTNVHYVAVDFEQERFADRLRECGFDTEQRTAWIWEGVAMYLPTEVVHDALRQITSLSAAGSHLIMSYRAPSVLPFGRVGRAVIPAVFGMIGEPLKSIFSPAELRAALSDGWEVLHDEGGREWRARTGSTARPPSNFAGERLVFARRRG